MKFNLHFPRLRSFPSKVRLIVTALLAGSCAPILGAKTYWVAPAPAGSDQNPGTREQPWATPQKAVASVEPGDTVYFRGGVYWLTSPVEPKISGDAKHWITFSGIPGERPIFDGSGYRLKPHQINEGLINITEASYIRLHNLTVRNSHGHGFKVRGPAGHIEIRECRADETFGPGIGLWNCDHVDVLYCEVEHTNTNRMRLYGNPRHPAIHEAISLEGATHFRVAYNNVHNGDKEGIDIKGPSAHGQVDHNFVHDMPRQGLYTDAWFGFLHDVRFTHNVVRDCEWGIGVSVEGKDSRMANITIDHNLVYRNRGSGIFFALWNANGPRRKILVAQNTFYHNGSPVHFSGLTGNIDVRSENVFDTKIVNNICSAGGAFEIGTFAKPGKAGLRTLKAHRIVISHNFIGTIKPPAENTADTINYDSEQYRRYGRSYSVTGTDPVLGKLQLTNPENGSFYLTASSPARHAGIPNRTVSGRSPDLGAFPYGSDLLPDVPPTIEPVFHDVYRLEKQTVPGRHYSCLVSYDGGKTWKPYARDPVGNYVTDIHYVTVHADSDIRFRYEITDLGTGRVSESVEVRAGVHEQNDNLQSQPDNSK